MDRLSDLVRAFLDDRTLSPHGICLFWRPELIWTHVVSDAVIGAAYFSIPLALGVFLHGRRDLRFGWVIWMFVAFIMLCGVTHIMSIWTLWHADYGAEALVKAATAAASLLTAAALWPLLPRVIAIPSAAMLEARVAERDKAVADLTHAMRTMVEMREHEARQKLLLDELNHRVKNTLTAVQSIAEQTLNHAADLETFRESFVDRLMALSATHNLLVRTEWKGATFQDLVDHTLGHYGRPYIVSGVDLGLGANVAVSLGLALHELATNAVKYGAWSAARGMVALAVAMEGDDQVRIVWRETGGRPVKPPRQRGFGARLLERGVAGELGGKVTLEFASEGLVCVIRAPVSAMLQPVDWPAAAAEA